MQMVNELRLAAHEGAIQFTAKPNHAGRAGNSFFPFRADLHSRRCSFGSLVQRELSPAGD